MNIEQLLGIALGVCFVVFVSYAVYKEKKVHKNKPTFHKDIK